MSVVVLICLCLGGLVISDNFPSLLTTNATLAIVIDREYTGDNYETIKNDIEAFLVYGKREILKHGGLNYFFFSWTTINVKRDFSAIISVASCTDTWRLFHIAEREHIFHMALLEANCPRLPPEKAIAIPIVTRGEELSQVVLDLRTASIFNWKSLVIAYDETLTSDMSNRVVRSMTQRSNDDAAATSISIMKLRKNMTRADIKNMLSTVHRETVGYNFMAIVNYGLVGTIMEYAKSLNLVDTKSQWMYVISDTNKNFHDMELFQKLLKEGDNIAFVYNASTVSNTGSCAGGMKCQSDELLTGFFKAMDAAVINEFEIASQVSDEEWEAIRPTKYERRQFLHASVKNYLSKYGVCDNCTFWQIETGDTWGVEYQRIGNLANPQLIFVGTWRPTEGPTMRDELFIHIAHGFRGKVLPMVSFHNPPWQVLKFNESGEVIEYKGLTFDVINELSRNLNFTYKVDVMKKLPGNINISATAREHMVSLEGYLTNEVPPTLFEMVKNKTVALGACAVTIIDEYKNAINYTIPISTQTYSFLVARPRELSRALLFTSPFTGNTWLCLAAAIVAMGPCLYYIHRYSPVYEYKGFPKKGGLSSVQNCIWYMYGALLQQGGMHLPYADSARVVVGAWWLVVLVIATTYCGNLVAFLTFPKIDIPITTIDELITHSDIISWSFRDGNFLEYELKISNEPRFRALYERRRKYRQIKEVIAEVSSGTHVLIDWKMKLQYIMKNQFSENGRCDFVLGLDDFINEQLAFIIAQDTPYLGIINDEIKKLHQVGLVEKWLKDYLPKRDRCWKNRHIIEINNHTVNLDDMQGIFFVLFFGFLIATLWLGFEKIWHNYFSKRKDEVVKPFAS